MKRIILTMALIISVIGVSAQKANVSKAKSKALAADPNFKEARELIKPALTDPATMDDANTWYVAGLIGSTENKKLYDLAKSYLPYDEKAKGEALIAAYHYFLKADDLGQIPDEKGKVKNKFRKDIVKDLTFFYSDGLNLINYAAQLYDTKENYKDAYDVFSIYLGIPSLPIMEGVALLKDTTYSQIQYYTALAASNAKMPQEAIEMYKKCIDADYEKYGSYQLLYNEYLQLKDTANFVQTLKDGFVAFPKESWFLQNLINYYIYSNQSEEAIKYLDNAIANEPNIAEYYFVKGRLEEEIKNIDAANTNYNKALELNDKLAGAYAGKGRILFNQGVEIQNNAATIRDNVLYNAEVAKSEALIKQSLPLYVKAEALDENELEYKEALKQIYYRLQMNDKYDEMVQKISKLREAQ